MELTESASLRLVIEEKIRANSLLINVDGFFGTASAAEMLLV
jgi:hypothetical protein